jgi:hypothetical protein
MRAVIALSMAALVACADGPVSPQVVALDEAEALWNRTKPASASYSFDQQVMCFCPYGASTFRVTVTAGAITRVHDSQAAADLPANQFSRFRTVDQLFDEVRSALAKSGVLTTVEYHPTMGFPSKVSLDPVKNAVDDEVAYFTAFLLASS